jgi:hypothetical protein
VDAYRCDGCGVTNHAINDLTGMRHVQTANKPSNCDGRYRLAEDQQAATPQEVRPAS